MLVAGDAIEGTGLAGAIAEKMAETFGEAFKLTVTLADGTTTDAPAQGLNAWAEAVINYIKENAVVTVQSGQSTLTGTIQ